MKKWTEQSSIGELVIYKNNQLIAFNKPAGLPVQADKTGDKSLLDLAEIYCQHPVHLIHRIDRPASGLTLFAKTTGALQSLNEQFRERTVEKTYLAVVGAPPPQQEGELVHYLRKNPHNNRSYASDQPGKGDKKAILHYRLLASSDNYHLLSIQLLTGRHHQIRAQLAAIGSPVKGDVKYGFRRANRDRSIHLHAWRLRFVHPTSGEPETLIAPLPEENLWQAFDLPETA